MLHSIIIPHRGRVAHLTLCLWSITESERQTGVTDYQIVLAHQGGAVPFSVPRLWVLHLPDDGGTFNKPKLLNAAIDAARGQLVTFLDCDALVAPAFLAAATQARDRRITRLCYRVRKLPSDWLPVLSAMPDRELRHMLGLAFDRYDDFPRAYEGYCNPDYNPPRPLPNQLVFGNSQFTCHRDALGDVRFHEHYAGHGFEDLDFIWRLWKRHFVSYRGVLADRVLFHFAHPYEPDWNNPDLTAANLARYRRTRHVL